jgi:hypothetical protein
MTEKDRDYSRQVWRTKVNLCKITKQGITNFMIQLFLKDFDKFANFKLECPFKKVRHLKSSNLVYKIFFHRDFTLIKDSLFQKHFQ